MLRAAFCQFRPVYLHEQLLFLLLDGLQFGGMFGKILWGLQLREGLESLASAIAEISNASDIAELTSLGWGFAALARLCAGAGTNGSGVF